MEDLHQIIKKNKKELRFFAKRRYCSEILEFYDSVQIYKAIVDDEKRQVFGLGICDKFVKEDSECSIGCITYEIRENIINQIEEYPRTLFDQLEEHVLLDFKISLLPEFLNETTNQQQQKPKKNLKKKILSFVENLRICELSF
eukprot:TRINITY_DN5772_c0_g1_i1.p1 TRINITY_DN5772_c0_g1~~TRINITY_DN5772_c0_g1_i1.p1  ORF type:complete len:143 (+),score=15.34 TRINITY_DN5772_c0_g1_i1:9-437(+)